MLISASEIIQYTLHSVIHTHPAVELGVLAMFAKKPLDISYKHINGVTIYASILLITRKRFIVVL